MAVECIGSAFGGGEEHDYLTYYDGAAGAPHPVRAAFGALATMLQAKGGAVDLADAARLQELAAGVAAQIPGGEEMMGAAAQAAAACAATNQGLAEAAAARRRLSEAAGGGGAASSASLCALTDQLAALTLPNATGGAPLFPGARSPCVDGALPPSILAGGCTLPAALNFDSRAVLPHTAACRIAGCTEPEAAEYDPRATQDDGSCAQARPHPHPNPNPRPRPTPEP